MATDARYWTLVASLPALPDFERAERLPINPERLGERLAMLEPDDAAEAARVQDFLHWQRQPVDRTDAAVIAGYRRLMDETRNPTLRAIATYRLERRVVQAALRRRHEGLDPLVPEAIDALPDLARTIRDHASAFDLGLGRQFPWIAGMAELLEAGDAYGLERFLMRQVWDRLGRLAEGRPFAFDAVLVYLFRWDILARWLAYDAGRAARRFDRLVSEALGEHDDPFATA
ncbi:MAG: DUF2764 family protein [Azospirillaceae bacterium]